MNPIVQSMTNASSTLNGGATLASSSDPVVDLFFQIGAMRGWEDSMIVSAFERAFEHNPERALKVLFWARDIRQGSGERNTFRVLLNWLAVNHPNELRKNLHLVAEYGRIDDLFSLEGTPLEEVMLELVSSMLKDDYSKIS